MLPRRAAAQVAAPTAQQQPPPAAAPAEADTAPPRTAIRLPASFPLCLQLCLMWRKEGQATTPNGEGCGEAPCAGELLSWDQPPCWASRPRSCPRSPARQPPWSRKALPHQPPADVVPGWLPSSPPSPPGQAAAPAALRPRCRSGSGPGRRPPTRRQPSCRQPPGTHGGCEPQLPEAHAPAARPRHYSRRALRRPARTPRQAGPG
mmetsp:Transcript_29875/g.84212  ORF Transcript_29875/g.84212 Transcript_29875/m.84212 type:complete len:205 (-) Transcript_29875:286-900(-)